VDKHRHPWRGRGWRGARRLRPTPVHESTGNLIDDSSITVRVKAAIFDDASLKVLDIHVVSNHGVELTGFVKSHNAVNHASDVVSKVAGVVGVQNDLVVREPSGGHGKAARRAFIVRPVKSGRKGPPLR
jgi:hypothetical protein